MKDSAFGCHSFQKPLFLILALATMRFWRSSPFYEPILYRTVPKYSILRAIPLAPPGSIQAFRTDPHSMHIAFESITSSTVECLSLDVTITRLQTLFSVAEPLSIP